MKRALSLMILSLAILLLSLPFWVGHDNTPSNVIRDYVQYVAAEKVNDAFALLSEKMQLIESSHGGVAALAIALAPYTKLFNGNGGINAIDITSVTIIENTTIVKFVITFGNRSTIQYTGYVIKQNDNMGNGWTTISVLA